MTAADSSSVFGRLAARFVRWNVRLSKACDRLLPSRYQVDGNSDFLASFVPRYIRPEATIYDIDGGKHPCVTADQKRQLGLTVVGVDINEEELLQAPAGVYNRTICGDICNYRGRAEADLVICRAVLEHVEDADRAFASIADILKPGALALVFVPSRNALFARLNLLLPEEAKRRILFFVYPETRDKGGFQSHYDRCTPREFRRLAGRHGLEIEDQRLYFKSTYFFCLFPAYLLWRAWLLLFCAVAGEQAAETFCMALRKSAQAPAGMEAPAAASTGVSGRIE